MLSKTKVFGNHIIIILVMITKDGRTKDGETINRDGIKDGKIIHY
jgi:hypothetical protein